MAISQRLREEESEMVEKKTLDIMIEKKMKIKESDVIHALIRKHIKELTAADVLEYRRKYLGKDD
ncbi:hypothetical protein ACT43R_18510 [Acinetobacter baumannii]|uniref:hypothetical protein n=1 Tax=Acinetobacter TaxID=469 RepID=UPI0004F54381|nr:MULTISPECIES: hypothetical protein [Acinetobacter]EKW7505942.1 hypothetical protein [Acinetobacter baumannii]EMF0907543.1 hypothetical protein [Acinetobacter baumannii]MCT9292147.1 hypothetical protein [Acinetobacter baumannii]MCT9292154.1 hypothetical protein [Acinetobacter baumannii]MDC4581258.1 hypothetical protein [Acinetobacter baumannii]